MKFPVSLDLSRPAYDEPCAEVLRKSGMSEGSDTSGPGFRRRHSKGLATRARILRVAERLFAEHGLDGVSLREITAEAEVDLALVNYHFKSKDRLYQTIIARRANIISRARQRALRNHGPNPTIEQIVESFIYPFFQRVRSRDPGWGHYAALIAQISFSRKYLDFQHEYLDPTAEVFVDVLSRLNPHGERQVLYWIYGFMVGSFAQILIGWERIQRLSGSTSGADAMDQAYEQLCRYTVSGIKTLLDSR